MELLARALVEWFRANRRRLPWRERPSVYGTVVSEFMLQQTQVATVVPYFDRWMRELPGFAALAAAPEDRVLKLWEGLGYYSRARNLHRLAEEVAERARLPQTAAEWRELPGVGPYTAAAIASIAFGQPVAVVDGNVVRVLARLTGDETRFSSGAAAVAHFQELAGALLDPERAGDHNQAMMELGATVCLKRRPQCLLCPWRADCRALKQGRPEELPQLERRPKVDVAVVRYWVERKGELLVHRIPPEGRRMAGLHELPTGPQLGWAEETAEPEPDRIRFVGTRGITHHRIRETILIPRRDARLPRNAEMGRLHLFWIPRENLGGLAFSGPHRRWVDHLLAERGGRRKPSRPVVI
ncbi:MAG: A/G-specific adenine glycosylase [Puniceicoccaceae bacterium]|nr:MAG: A/G-specific adenine glycosylase [Puniceicoccaceae bacterium]